MSRCRCNLVLGAATFWSLSSFIFVLTLQTNVIISPPAALLGDGIPVVEHTARTKGDLAQNDKKLGRTHDAPKSVPIVQALRDNVVISGQNFDYRYPSAFHSESNNHHEKNTPVVLVGVLSAASNSEARQSIRDTWASRRHAESVYFLVAGPWKNIEDEFRLYGDLFWIDLVEDYRTLTYKVQAFLYAVDNHVVKYDYVYKTDDDAYVYIPQVTRLLQHGTMPYWGRCRLKKPLRNPNSKWFVSQKEWSREYFPPYALGMGYAISRDFVKCILSKLATVQHFWIEDVATGMLAEKCNVTCQNGGWPQKGGPLTSTSDFAGHLLKTRQDMLRKHELVLSMWEIV